MCCMQGGAKIARVIRSFFLLCVTLGLDQGIKLYARTYPTYWEGTFFSFTENAGLVFSIPLSGVWLWGILIGAGAALLFLFFHSFSTGRIDACAALACIAGGGISNTIDRIRFGAVTDLFIFPGGLLFNFADIAIIIGIVWFLWPKSLPHLS